MQKFHSLLFMLAVSLMTVQPARAFTLPAPAINFMYEIARPLAKDVLTVLIANGIIAAVAMSYSYAIASAHGDATRARALTREKPSYVRDQGDIAPSTVPPYISRIIAAIKKPEQVQRFKVHLSKGMLLVGESGTGKTHMGYYLAKETGCRILRQSAAGLIDAAQGTGAASIHSLFERAQTPTWRQWFKEKSHNIVSWIMRRPLLPPKPTIVLLEDIDAIGARRGDVVDAGVRDVREQERVAALELLLTELDGAPQDRPVFVVGTTRNQRAKRVLEPALIRDGRLPIVRLLRPETEQLRQEILQLHAPKYHCSAEIDDNFLKALAAQTEHFSGNNLKALFDHAAFAAYIADEKNVDAVDVIKQQDLISAWQRALRAKGIPVPVWRQAC